MSNAYDKECIAREELRKIEEEYRRRRKENEEWERQEAERVERARQLRAGRGIRWIR